MWNLLLTFLLVDPTPPLPPGQDRPAVMIGSQHPKWAPRKRISKELTETGGVELVAMYRNGIAWLAARGGETGFPCEEGREVGLNALVSLTLLGDSSTTRSGAYRRQLAPAIRLLRGKEAQGSEEDAKQAAAVNALDQALKVHALSESFLSNQLPVEEKAVSAAVATLIELRSEDGLWHEGDKAEAPADALTCGIAGYALFAARDAGIQVPDEAFESILKWTQQAEVGDGDARTAAILTARIFSSAALRRSLLGDERVAELAALVGRNVPAPAEQGAQPPAVPPIAFDPLFAYLATLCLYQADNLAWGRLNRWLLERSREQQVREGENAGSWPAAPTGGLPTGSSATAALRLLAIQNGFREPVVPSMVQ